MKFFAIGARIGEENPKIKSKRIINPNIIELAILYVDYTIKVVLYFTNKYYFRNFDYFLGSILIDINVENFP